MWPSLVTGLRKENEPVFTWTWRTFPLASGNTCVTRPGCHLRGRCSSYNSTISSTARFFRTSCHFCRTCSVYKYSLVQRRQTGRQCTAPVSIAFERNCPPHKKTPGGRLAPSWPASSRWFRCVVSSKGNCSNCQRRRTLCFRTVSVTWFTFSLPKGCPCKSCYRPAKYCLNGQWLTRTTFFLPTTKTRSERQRQSLARPQSHLKHVNPHPLSEAIDLDFAG